MFLMLLQLCTVPLVLVHFPCTRPKPRRFGDTFRRLRRRDSILRALRMLLIPETKTRVVNLYIIVKVFNKLNYNLDQLNYDDFELKNVI